MGLKQEQFSEVWGALISDRKCEYPYAREDTFERKLKRHRSKVGALRDDIAAYDPANYLEARELATALERSCLTRHQREVFDLYLNGNTLEEIGRRFGITKQAVYKNLRLVKAKMRRASRQNPYTGLADVYRSELCRTSGRIGRKVCR